MQEKLENIIWLNECSSLRKILLFVGNKEIVIEYLKPSQNKKGQKNF